MVGHNNQPTNNGVSTMDMHLNNVCVTLAEYPQRGRPITQQSTDQQWSINNGYASKQCMRNPGVRKPPGPARPPAHMVVTYLVCFRAEEEKIKRNGCDNVNKKPAFEIVHGDLAGMADYLVVFIHISSSEIDENINYKHDIYDEIYDGQRVTVSCISIAVFPRFVVLFIE